MKVTEKQLQIMFRVFEGTLNMSDRTDMNLFGYDKETRLRIFNQVLNQQSNELVEVERVSGDGVFFRCINCNFEPMMESKTDDLLNMNFCPKCGNKFK